MFRVCSCLVAGAIGVAPPAVLSAPVQPAVLPANAVVSQTSGINVGMAAAPALNSPSAQFAPRLRGQPAMMPSYAGGNAESAVMQTVGHLSDDVADDSFREVSQPMYAPKASSSEWASSLGALVLAAATGAVAGSLWLRRRVRAVQTKDSSTTEMVWAEKPKFAVAALATRTSTPFGPLARKEEWAGGIVGSEYHGWGTWKYDPLQLSERWPEHLPWYREAELKHGRVAMLAWLGLIVPDFVRIPLPDFEGNDLDMVTAHNKLIYGLGSGPMWVLLAFCGIVESLRFRQLGLGFEKLTLENAGDLNFGKGFMPKTEEGRTQMRMKELKNGRLAMFAFGGAITQGTLFNEHHFPFMPMNAKKTDTEFTRAQQQLAGAFVAGAAAMPQPAAAAELTYDGFGPPELVAIFLPITLIVLGYLEWESKQPGVDDITGVGTLGKTVDGAPNDPLSYKRRSPEYD